MGVKHTWQWWIGKFLLAAVAIIGAVFEVFGIVDVPWLLIVTAAAVQVAQWLLAWIPGIGWQVVIGKALLLVVSIVEVIIAHGTQIPIWATVSPLIVALAQYIISLVPQEPAPT